MASEHSLFEDSDRDTLANLDRARLNRLLRVATAMTIVLGVSVLIQLLLPYRGYFPADLQDSVFLSAHRGHFHGWYRFAFYDQSHWFKVRRCSSADLGGNAFHRGTVLSAECKPQWCCCSCSPVVW